MLCLNVKESQPKYAYKGYAYKKGEQYLELSEVFRFFA